MDHHTGSSVEVSGAMFETLELSGYIDEIASAFKLSIDCVDRNKVNIVTDVNVLKVESISSRYLLSEP